MPIYEYRCTKCDSHFEKMQKISDEAPSVCEKCGGSLEKQWSLSGFQFKGAGWYVTDYTNKGKAESKAESNTELKSEAKSDGKSEGKSESKSAAPPPASEKSSASESTAKPESASKTTKSNVSTSKKE